MKFVSKMLVVVVAAAVGLGVTACDRHATKEGQQTNLEFQYIPADGETDEFDRPIAVGSHLTMEVQPLGRAFDGIVAVRTSPPGVVEAVPDQSEPDQIHLTGVGDGDVELEVEVQGVDGSYTDWIELRVRDVAEIEMSHRCTDLPEAAYPQGRAPSLEFERRSLEGDRLVGAADNTTDPLEGCQAWLYPEEYQQLPTCDSAGLHFPVLEQLGVVELDVVEEVAVDDRGAPYLDVHVFDPDAMEFVQPSEAVRVGRSSTFELIPFIDPPTEPGTVDACAELEVEILTPDVCEFDSVGDDTTTTTEPEDDYEVEIEGLASGVCDLDVYLAGERDIAPWPIAIDVVE